MTDATGRAAESAAADAGRSASDTSPNETGPPTSERDDAETPAVDGDAVDDTGADTPTEPPVVAVEDLTKTYGEDVRALDGVSFSIRPGEVVGLLGPNGAGKTTCIKSTLGLVDPSGGRVEVAGTDAQANPRRAYGRVGAMLEGARNVYWRLTPRENLAFFTGIAGDRPSTVADRHEELLERLDLAEKADETVKDLSRGMKQKVSLATTLARDVDVAFLDEPTLGLDVESSLELRRELATLADEEGLAVVLSSHDMDVIQDLCDRVIILSDREIIADDDVEALLDVFRTQTYEVAFEPPEGGDGDGVSTGDAESGADGATSRNGADDGDADTLEERLRSRYEVTDWTQRGDRTVVTVTLESGNDLPSFTGTVVEAGADLHRVASVEPDLEEVFLRITGGDEP
ncbi:ABC transporter ATP-binding protein [Halobaculum sp. MBLA0147]|uniref:ABC transporter ATP-binding protein n=1 Tax=Halobaculum sp. MBLA0147 TaxID=3079934 RepID=UPI003524AEAE